MISLYSVNYSLFIVHYCVSRIFVERGVCMNLTITDITIRLVLSVVLSGLIGFEREYTKKPAGFRTHILVSIGATTVMIAGLMMFRDYSSLSNMDPSRLGAQVISGIGFLGAGTILREGFTVKGLTTAASIWAVGCIGLVVGGGYYVLSSISTLTVFITLKIFGKVQHKYENTYEVYLFHIKYTDDFNVETLFQYLDKRSLQLLSLRYNEEDAEFTLRINKSLDYIALLKKISEEKKIYSTKTRVESEIR